MFGGANNQQLVGSLCQGSYILDILRDSFAGIQNRFRIFTALETQSVHLVGKIVEDESAKLEIANETVVYIPGDHRSMCKFSNPEEIGYERLVSCLEEILDDLVNTHGDEDANHGYDR